MSVGQCIALLKAEVERKLASAIIVFSACPRSPLTRPGIPAGGHGLLPQLQAREPAAHTGTVSEQCLEPNRALLAATQTDFGPDGFRSSNPTTPASQSRLRASKSECRSNGAVPHVRGLISIRAELAPPKPLPGSGLGT